MKLFTSRELARATHLEIPGGVIIAKALMQIFRYNRLNRVYASTYDTDPVVFINSILEHLDVRFDIPEKDLENIPADGAFITVSNHLFRGNRCPYTSQNTDAAQSGCQGNGQLSVKEH
ncbi:MAG: hypothetical protein R2758_04750 [Bacteroidales bacterium]